MHSNILNRNKHESFLADHRKDPYTGELLKVGDNIVICAKCKTAYLESSWKVKDKCFVNPKQCESKETLEKIPNEKSITNLNGKTITKTKVVVEKKKTFPFGWIIAIILGIIILVNLEPYQRFKQEAALVPSLNSKISTYKLENENSDKKFSDMAQKYSTLNTNYYSLKNIVSNWKFTTGMPYDTRKSKDYNYGNYTERVFFNIKYPIKLSSMKVDAKGTGYLIGKIYTKDGIFVGEATNNEITDGIESLNFNLILDAGEYYITHDGNTELLYNFNFNTYPILSNGIVEITGTAFNGNNFYMYYYDWSYVLNVK